MMIHGKIDQTYRNMNGAYILDISFLILIANYVTTTSKHGDVSELALDPRTIRKIGE